MRNVIRAALAGCLIILPALSLAPLGAQTRVQVARWSPGCFPPGCRDSPRGAPPLAWGASAPGLSESLVPSRVALWPHAFSALTALALASALDNQIQTQIQEHRTESGDDLARLVRRGGEPEVYLPVALGTVAVGLVSGDGRILRAGGRISGGLLLAGVAASLLKPLVGRARPQSSLDAHDFRPFSSRDSWPSGHTTMAFALATSVSDEVGFTPVTIAAYGMATLTGWSRVNDNRHWATDVAGGALVGIASAKLMNGRWRVFGISAPRFLLEGDRVGMGLAF